MSATWESILDEVVRRWPAERWLDVGVTVGCSGGADSVALSRALVEIRGGVNGSHVESGDRGDSRPRVASGVGVGSRVRGEIVIAHHHHGVRGEEADRDEAFVRRFAGELGVRVVVGRGSGTRADEATLRGERYAFLQEAAAAAGSRYVAVAHSADDNVETLLHHLFRGTGPSGLCGIPPFRDLGPDLVLARPMLSVRRHAIREGLREIGQSWREDASNRDATYRRNWIRSEIFPRVESRYPAAAESMLRTIDSLGGWRDVIATEAARWLEVAVASDEPLVLRQPPSAAGPFSEAAVIDGLQSLWDRRGWARSAMSAAHWKRLAATCRRGEPDRYMLPGDREVTRDGGEVTIRPAIRASQRADPPAT